MRYATSLRATASVARLAFPFWRAFSYTNARSGFRLGANFAASTRTHWICLFRCFEIGVRATLSADRFSSPQSPQARPKHKSFRSKKTDEGSQISNQNCWLQSADVTRGFTGFHSGLTSARYSAEASSWR